MKLASIINLWDGEELLVGSMRSVKDGIDLFIIVYQEISNFGELYNPLLNLPVEEMDKEFQIVWLKYDPLVVHGMQNEIRKRNMGINVARNLGCTHFLHMDCDEYYLPGEFVWAKNYFIKMGALGSVVDLYTYFKSAELRQENPDSYFVPFIHAIADNTIAGAPNYPFYVDPTRKINCPNVIQIPITMQHYSWVRRDIERKARNSSARKNIEKSSLMSDWKTAQEGSVVNGGNKLRKVEDYFGINEMIVTLESR